MHGYNTSFDEAVLRAAQVACDVSFQGSLTAPDVNAKEFVENIAPLVNLTTPSTTPPADPPSHSWQRSCHPDRAKS
ncbi:MAG: alpha/beta hydrolase [Lewinellaceae bacterium]|nr:alpha/beta hydrolase [Phaeodactylibacter sp.]MCB9347949.1 alpha/beta hydrolase [Lewinellaceae bacterium]